jgi:hypothetical protein
MSFKYRRLNEYLKEKYGERVLKICVDGGFTCPNRDGFKGVGGCIYCSQRGSGDHLKELSIKDQVLDGLEYKKNRANKFIVYFQNYTNTYGDVENLKSKYEEAIICDKIVCLDIATRPDCITEDICKMLASFKSKVDVWVELGLQTSNDNTGKLINRCYDSKDFTNAVNMLNKYDIDVITHIMIGLPRETHTDLVNTIDFINKHNIQGIKIHSTYIIQDTILADMYQKGEYKSIDLDYYIKEACFCLTHLNPNIVIHKISGDAPKDLLIAPSWNLHKKWIMNGIDKYLREKIKKD